MTQIYNFKYYDSWENRVLNIILNGFNDTNESKFIKLLYNHCKQNQQSVISFDYKFQYLNQDQSSWPDLEEEIYTLDLIIQKYSTRYEKINFIAKSFGGIVTSKYLLNRNIANDISVKILWYIHDDVDLTSFITKVTIIQWERDRFWTPDEIRMKIIQKYKTDYIDIITMPWWDHSYRNIEKTNFVWLQIIKKNILL